MQMKEKAIVKSFRYSRIEDYTNRIAELEFKIHDSLPITNWYEIESCQRELQELEAELYQLAANDPLIEDVSNDHVRPKASG